MLENRTSIRTPHNGMPQDFIVELAVALVASGVAVAVTINVVPIPCPCTTATTRVKIQNTNMSKEPTSHEKNRVDEGFGK